jgi:hypothetical protein
MRRASSLVGRVVVRDSSGQVRRSLLPRDHVVLGGDPADLGLASLPVLAR